MTSTFRTAALVALIPLIFAVLGVVIVQGQLRDRLMTEAQTRLEAEVQGFEALYDQRRIPALREAIEYRALRGDPAGSVYLLTDRDGAALAGTYESWPKAAPAPPFRGQADLSGRAYLLDTRELRGGFDLLTGVALAPVEATLAGMRGVFAGFGALMVAAGLAAAWIVARGAQARTARLNAALADVGGAGGLSVTMPRDAPEGSEHAELARNIDAMLARITHLFEAHQRLGNAVAHEMRTPLARIRARLNTLDLDAASRAGLDEEIRTTIRLFDSLLAIAQLDADAGNTAALSPVDLSEIAATLGELYGPVAEEDGRALTLDLQPGARMLGDAQLLSQMISNLVENALKYTRPGDEIRLSVAVRGDRVVLTVADTGPGADPGLRERLFTPFARGQGHGSVPGHGLGLSLVQAIAVRHGAKPRLLETEKGFAIEVSALHISDR
ncbi:MAG: HAMP domain-containing sensor histidine kinase [Pseudomonadota bacterium]